MMSGVLTGDDYHKVGLSHLVDAAKAAMHAPEYKEMLPSTLAMAVYEVQTRFLVGDQMADSISQNGCCYFC